MIFGRLQRWLAAAGAAVLAFVGAYLLGRRDARQAGNTERERDYRKTREAIDDAEIHGNDPDAARRWLHEYTSDKR